MMLINLKSNLVSSSCFNKLRGSKLATSIEENTFMQNLGIIRHDT